VDGDVESKFSGLQPIHCGSKATQPAGMLQLTFKDALEEQFVAKNESS